jgi:hypothetical protein
MIIADLVRRYRVSINAVPLSEQTHPCNTHTWVAILALSLTT